MIEEILLDAEAKMKTCISVLENDLQSILPGQSLTTLVENIVIDYFGNPTPLYQLAELSVQQPRIITIRPLDPSAISEIEKGIRSSDPGLLPNNDGSIIRLAIPPLTHRRREDLVKRVRERLEEARASIRSIRRASINEIRKLEKDKTINEDEMKLGQDDAQRSTDKYITMVDEKGKLKEQEIMEF